MIDDLFSSTYRAQSINQGDPHTSRLLALAFAVIIVPVILRRVKYA